MYSPSFSLIAVKQEEKFLIPCLMKSAFFPTKFEKLFSISSLFFKYSDSLKYFNDHNK